MGLDITFDWQQASRAGLTYTVDRNGTNAEIRTAKEEYGEYKYGDADYVNWLKKFTNLLAVPTTDILTPVSLIDGQAHVSANKCDKVYAPLTEFLAEHNIPWEEY
jgi:hypothetical protein